MPIRWTDLMPVPLDYADRLSRGEPVAHAPGACAQCYHALVWHERKRGRNSRRCERCSCSGYEPNGCKLRDTRVGIARCRYDIQDLIDRLVRLAHHD